MGFHLHSFCHNHYITEESLAGKTPEKTKIVSELVRKKKKRQQHNKYVLCLKKQPEVQLLGTRDLSLWGAAVRPAAYP